MTMMKSTVQSLSDHGCCIWCHFTIIIMPRWAEPRRHAVVGLCVCLSAGFLVARWKLSDETSYTTKLDICSEMNCKNFGYKAWFVSYALWPDLPQVDTCKVRVLNSWSSLTHCSLGFALQQTICMFQPLLSCKLFSITPL